MSGPLLPPYLKGIDHCLEIGAATAVPFLIFSAHSANSAVQIPSIRIGRSRLS
jgi:hypothetical protein